MNTHQHERVGTLLQVIILVVVVAVATVNVWLTFAYRSAWHHSQVGEYQLCLQREAYDQRAHSLEQADAVLMQAMIDTDRNSLFTPVRNQRDTAFEAKLQRDQDYLNTPVVDGCELIKP